MYMSGNDHFASNWHLHLEGGILWIVTGYYWCCDCFGNIKRWRHTGGTSLDLISCPASSSGGINILLLSNSNSARWWCLHLAKQTVFLQYPNTKSFLPRRTQNSIVIWVFCNASLCWLTSIVKFEKWTSSGLIPIVSRCILT